MGILRDYLNDTRAFEFKRQLMAEERARADAASASLYEPVQGQVTVPSMPGRAPQYDDTGRMVGPAGPPGGPLLTQGPVMPGPDEVHRRMQEAALRLDPAVAAQLFASTRGQDVDAEAAIKMQGMRNDQSGRENAARLAQDQAQWTAANGGSGALPLHKVNLQNAQEVRRGNSAQADKWSSEAALQAALTRAGIDADRMVREDTGAPAEYYRGMQDVYTAGTRESEMASSAAYYGNRADAYGALTGKREADRDTTLALLDPKVQLAYEKVRGQEIGNLSDLEEMQQLRLLGTQKLRAETARADVEEGTIASRIGESRSRARRAGARADLSEGLVKPTLDKATWDAATAEIRNSIASADLRSAQADAEVAAGTVDSRISKSTSVAARAKALQADAEAKLALEEKYGEKAIQSKIRAIEVQIGRTLADAERISIINDQLQEYGGEYARLRNEHLESKIRKNDRVSEALAKLPEGLRMAYDKMSTAYWSADDEKTRQAILKAGYQQFAPYGLITMKQGRNWAGLSKMEFQLTGVPQAIPTAGSNSGADLDLMSGEM